MSILDTTNKKIVAALIAVVVAAALSCGPRVPKKPPRPRKMRAETDMLNVFFTGSTFGRLKPCGCSGGQLGGLERRPVVFNTVPADKRLLIDTGSLVETNSDQDLIKFDIIVEALRLLDYDLVNLTEDDLEIAANRGLLANPIVRFVSPYGDDDEMARGIASQYLLSGEYVNISVLTFDVDRSPLEQIRQGFGPPKQGEKSFNILLVNRCDETIIASVARLGIVDCLVCPSDADEPMLIGSASRKPLVFSVGRFGRYICRLQIEKARVRDRLKLKFQAIEVGEDLDKDPSLMDLYKGYQQIVKDRNLLAQHPRYVLANGLKYVGSQSCKACHKSEYEKWHDTGHASAYATLEDHGSQFDPECVVCHVVGMDYESGFVSAEETAHMKNVGCENCHGPGSEHVKNPIQAKTGGPQSTCLECHTPEHSGEYAGNERSFQQKIIHWTEPNAPGNVK